MIRVKRRLEILSLAFLLLAGNFITTPAIAQIEPPAVEWEKTYGGGEQGFSVDQTVDGGFILSGRIDRRKDNLGWDAVLIKTDQDGNEVWKMILDHPGIYGNSVQQTSDGGYVLAGGAEPTFGVVLKIRADGTVLWEERFGGEVRDIQQTTDGGYVLLASGLVKTDPDGKIQWQGRPGGSSVCQTSDGGYIVVGRQVIRIGDLLKSTFFFLEPMAMATCFGRKRSAENIGTRPFPFGKRVTMATLSSEQRGSETPVNSV